MENREAVEKQTMNIIELFSNQEKVKQLIEKGEVEFSVKDKFYRVRKPTYKDRQETSQKRSEKYVELLKSKSSDGSYKYLAEADLRKLYKDRGIDIEEFDTKIRILRIKEKEALEKLGNLLKNDPQESQALALKEEIEGIREEIRNITIEKTNLLDFTIEQQIMVFVYSYYTFILTDIKVEEKWERAWKTFDEFMLAEEAVANEAGMYGAVLINEQLLGK